MSTFGKVTPSATLLTARCFTSAAARPCRMSLGRLVAALGLIVLGVMSTSPQAAAQSRAFSFNRWTTVTPAAGWSFVAGDFVPGGGIDLVGYHRDDGSVWVGTNRP